MAWWLFQNVVVTAILAIAVAIVCRTTRFGPVARHALWFIVLIKFVTPPVLVWPWAAPDPLGLAVADARPPIAVQNLRAADAAIASTSEIDSASVPTVSAESDSLARGNSDATRTSWSTIASAGVPWLLVLWIAGSACVLLIESARLARLARRVRAAGPGPADIARRVEVLANQLDMRAVPVITVADHISPAIWCLGPPRLLWPAYLPADASQACIDGLIVHELAHVQRRDHFVGWIELAAGVIWWWNPLFWYVRASLREQAELACDAWVISALPNGRRAYAESLLALSSAAVQGRSPAMAAVIGIRANNRRVLERRLVMIMQGRASRRLSVAGLAGIGVVALATLPAWATAAQTTVQSVPVVVAPAQAPTPAAAPSRTLPAPVTVQSPQTARPVAVPAQATTPPVVTHVEPGQHPVAVQTHPTIATTMHPAVVTTTHPAIATTVHPAVATTMHPAVTTAVPPTYVAVAPVPAQRAQTVPLPVGATVGEAVRQAGLLSSRVANGANLPAEGQQLREKFDADREAIQQEADRKVEARQADLVKSLQALQDQYAKAGKLDEAVAIRDYIRALESGLDRRAVIRKR